MSFHCAHTYNNLIAGPFQSPLMPVLNEDLTGVCSGHDVTMANYLQHHWPMRTDPYSNMHTNTFVQFHTCVPTVHNQPDWVHFEVPLSLWHSLLQLYIYVDSIQPSPNLHTQLPSSHHASVWSTDQIWRHPGWECKSCGFWSQVVAKQKLWQSWLWSVDHEGISDSNTRVASSLILYLVVNSYPSGCVGDVTSLRVSEPLLHNGLCMQTCN